MERRTERVLAVVPSWTGECAWCVLDMPGRRKVIRPQLVMERRFWQGRRRRVLRFSEFAALVTASAQRWKPDRVVIAADFGMPAANLDGFAGHFPDARCAGLADRFGVRKTTGKPVKLIAARDLVGSAAVAFESGALEVPPKLSDPLWDAVGNPEAVTSALVWASLWALWEADQARYTAQFISPLDVLTPQSGPRRTPRYVQHAGLPSGGATAFGDGDVGGEVFSYSSMFDHGRSRRPLTQALRDYRARQDRK
ncbi:hypothetical protein ACF064_01570 [Streptomyces sp. NPDC015492]|uniref:hypothetical protein n=1 Tax=Streptomyces sp. NPDC015492 TaxID=3364958 RepID=UPI003700B38E